MQLLKFTSYLIVVSSLMGCIGNGTKSTNVDANVESSIIEIPSQAAKDFTLAIGHMNQNKLDLAEKSFTKMTKDYPLLSGPFANLGVIYCKKGEWEKAQGFLISAVDKNSKNAKALNQLGYVYRQRGDFSNAEKSYKQAISSTPNEPAGYLNLGVLYDIYMGEFVKASQLYQKYQSLQSAPDRKVAGWIVDINRRAGISSKKTQIASEGIQ